MLRSSGLAGVICVSRQSRPKRILNQNFSRYICKINSHHLYNIICFIGQTEHVDAYHFVHQLPNKVVQIEYVCRKLTEAYDVLLDNTHDNHANLDKWKHFISSNTDEVSLPGTPILV